MWFKDTDFSFLSKPNSLLQIFSLDLVLYFVSKEGFKKVLSSLWTLSSFLLICFINVFGGLRPYLSDHKVSICSEGRELDKIISLGCELRLVENKAWEGLFSDEPREDGEGKSVNKINGMDEGDGAEEDSPAWDITISSWG